MYELQNEIIGLLPSAELREAIPERGKTFTEPELLKLVCDYAPDYETRLSLLERLRASFTGELREYAGRLIERQKFCLNELLTPEENAVYELHIKDHPDACDERYLCGSYEAAQKLIPLFYREYECGPTEETVFRIEKRKIYRGSDAEPFSEDYLGDAVLLPSGKLYSVNVRKGELDQCGGTACCSKCSLLCPENTDVEFPRIISRGDIVKFRCTPNQPERIGFVPFFCDSETEIEYYVIPLDCAMIRYRRFDTDFWDHEHIPAPLARKISPDELNEKMREDSLAFTEHLKSIKAIP